MPWTREMIEKYDEVAQALGAKVITPKLVTYVETRL